MVKCFVFGDIHWPKISEKSLYLAEKYLQEEKPEILVLNGDIIDGESVAKFPPHPKLKVKLKEEIDGAKSLLKEFRQIIPESQIFYVEGNHEWRLKQYLIRQAPELWEFIGLEEMLELKKLKIKFIKTRENAVRFIDTYIQIENWTIGHFDKALKEPGNSVRMIAQEKGIGNYVQGHTHKLAHITKRGLSGESYHLIEGGCLCDLKSAFTSETNWNNGFVILGDNPEIIIL